MRMRDFVDSGRLCNMRPLTTTVLALVLTNCNSPTYLAITAEKDALSDVTTDATSGEVTDVTGEAGTTGDSSTEAVEGTIDASSGTGGVSATGDTGTTAGNDTGDTDKADPPEVDKPSIVSVSLPAEVYAAGPVALEVQTEHTSWMRVERDGVDLGALADAGDGVFVGELPVRGAIDNGLHTIEVFAHHGPYEVSQDAGYKVSTPKPGTMAWSEPGPDGSRTNRIALTADGDVLEAGQVEINKVMRPGLRKRSGLDGTEIWSKALDTREGEVADLSVLPDGRVWIAMNVRKPGNLSPQPRIALFDAAGVFTGIEAFGYLGQGVRGIAADADGGCFAVGVASAGNDLDIGYWRVDGTGTQTLGDHWDYVPDPIKNLPHTFSELAMDVVIEGDVAWVVGASNGQHDEGDPSRTRGILVAMDLHTAEVVAPVIVAPKSAPYTQSVFLGAGHHPLGVLVTGYGCDDACTEYQIETSLYGPTGLRLWHKPNAAGAGKQYGSDVVVDSQGRALVSGAVTEKGVPRGYVFAYRIGGEEVFPLFEHWFPPSAAASEALGVLVDAYDRLFVGGYVTTNGATQAHLILLHE
jgi:hypothetical protein